MRARAGEPVGQFLQGLLGTRSVQYCMMVKYNSYYFALSMLAPVPSRNVLVRS